MQGCNNVSRKLLSVIIFSIKLLLGVFSRLQILMIIKDENSITSINYYRKSALDRERASNVNNRNA